jgi:hypothetical protein
MCVWCMVYVVGDDDDVGWLMIGSWVVWEATRAQGGGGGRKVTKGVQREEEAGMTHARARGERKGESTPKGDDEPKWR